VVHKPASATPVSAILLAEVLQESGLPKGALNVVTGSGAEVGDPLVMHDDVAMITFTGSADVGKRIRHLAGMKRVTLELGSNSTVILAADADLDAALPRCVTGAFAHSGQVCISVQHVLIAETLREEFTARFVEAAKKLVIGHPLEAATEISSLITAKEAERVVASIGEAVRSGARLLCGGGRQNATVAPAVLDNVPPNVALSCQEAFGPVVAINGFTSMEDAVARVNASPYGLQAGLYTRDLQQAFRIAGQLHVGGVHLNEVPAFRADHMPYGGVKLSGTGREGPKYAIEEMTEPKLITWNV
jgi:acyl-CoA reductase-like NAD-dependent aldehyde dehydrogenase